MLMEEWNVFWSLGEILSGNFNTLYSDSDANECLTPQLKHEEKNVAGIVPCIRQLQPKT